MSRSKREASPSERVERWLSLEQLEGTSWGESPITSYVVTTSYALRRNPLEDATIEELRLAIGQPPFERSLCYLIPLAVEHLRTNPMAQGDFYEGDLLKNVLEVPTSYWNEHPEQRNEVAAVVQEFLTQVEQNDDHWRSFNLPILEKSIAAFRSA
jgi:hypothetical protein